MHGYLGIGHGRAGGGVTDLDDELDGLQRGERLGLDIHLIGAGLGLGAAGFGTDDVLRRRISGQNHPDAQERQEKQPNRIRNLAEQL